MLLGLLLLAALIWAALIFPAFAVAVCAVILVLQIALIAVRVAASLSVPPRLPSAPDRIRPIFSVHVATHNEPADLVIETLDALAAQSWDANDFEVIVMDNNTADPAVWRPVEAHCRKLGRNFIFLHQMGVEWAKAGALNIALGRSRADATHIVTVDADYVVAPDFLKTAHAALERTGADYVQFPQSYVLASGSARGVDAELEEYFRSSAQIADGSEAVLLTGTLCVISKAALIACGGWSGITTTEDAEMGVRLCLAGFSGRFISQVVAKGLLPLSLRDLEKQRARWASGNLKTLAVHFAKIAGGSGKLVFCKRMAVLAQLTAWINLALLPVAILIAALAMRDPDAVVTTLAAATVLLVLGDLVFRLVYRGIRDGLPADTILRATASRLALSPVAAASSAETLLMAPKTFSVTVKSRADTRRPDLPLTQIALALLAVISLPAAFQVGTVPTLAVLSLLLPLPAALLTGRTLLAYSDIISTRTKENVA